MIDFLLLAEIIVGCVAYFLLCVLLYEYIWQNLK